MTSNYLVWNANPTAFTTGKVHLPVTLNLFGVVLAIILYFVGFSWLMKRKQAQLPPGKKKDEAELSGWTVLALIIGSFILGELVFAVLPSPTFSTFGPLRIRWYGIMFALAFLSGYFVGAKLFLKAGRSREQLETLLTYILFATVIGARLGHVLFYEPSYYFSHPAEIIKIWHGGLASHGAAIGILIAIWLFKRNHKANFLWTVDVVCTCVALGGSFVRIGNFFNSEIIGKVTHVPWAIIFARVDMLPRHPSMLYESVWYLSLFIILWVIWRKYDFHPPEGFVFGFFLIYMFTGRFLLEYTKVHQADFGQNWILDMGQILSIPFILLGIWILWKKVDWNKVRQVPES